MSYKIYVTADLHFHHKNIIKYCNRPFSSLEEMHEIFIQNWNKKVAPTNIIYCLGDFSFGNEAQNKLLLKSLNGNKILIRGNHDRLPKVSDGWSEIYDYKETKIDHKHIIMFHFPIKTWNRKHHGSWHLHGHEHHSAPDNPLAYTMDVGVDGHAYAPVSYDEVAAHMSNKTVTLKNPRIEV